jgi:hypothetical protein
MTNSHRQNSWNKNDIIHPMDNALNEWTVIDLSVSQQTLTLAKMWSHEMKVISTNEASNWMAA